MKKGRLWEYISIYFLVLPSSFRSARSLLQSARTIPAICSVVQGHLSDAGKVRCNINIMEAIFSVLHTRSQVATGAINSSYKRGVVVRTVWEALGRIHQGNFWSRETTVSERFSEIVLVRSIDVNPWNCSRESPSIVRTRSWARRVGTCCTGHRWVVELEILVVVSFLHSLCLLRLSTRKCAKLWDGEHPILLKKPSSNRRIIDGNDTAWINWSF